MSNYEGYLERARLTKLTLEEIIGCHESRLLENLSEEERKELLTLLEMLYSIKE